MKYIKIESSSCVDMLRLRIRFDGKPGEGFDWFEEFSAYVKVRFDKPDERVACTRYPRSLRVGTYREMLQIPVGKSSIAIGYGRNGKGEASELREGFIEFNPSKCYPSAELEYVYKLFMKDERVRLELVRWDFATDYDVPRSRVALLKDKRRYAYISSNGVTEYLGQRSNNGFVKLYDKQAELLHKGEECPNPRSRLEITIEEKPEKKESVDKNGVEILVNEWPSVALVPQKALEGVNGTFSVIVNAWSMGCNVEHLMDGLSSAQKTRYRKRIRGEIGVLPCPTDYGECRRDAYAWETVYGGMRGGDSDGKA